MNSTGADASGVQGDDHADRVLGESQPVRDYFGPAYGSIAGFGGLLREQGELRGLIGPREVSRLWERHLLNSGAVVPYLPQSGLVVDVGSGAGLPGIIIGMMRPDLRVVLIEPMERRTAWLEEVVAQWNLTNVDVRRGRAEEYHGAFEADAVTSRAVASLAKLARMSLPLLRHRGEMVVLKGRNVAQEIEPARKVLRSFKTSEPEILAGETVAGVEPTTILRLRRG
ncbi:16S rRNA (guanine(527)-N(7))-methyltransferase RsmG [Xylanimonas allomyrinae]|uniref:Ribosomal RNA small subunit methyltransferase G n=1 Tax=Xylanimonas allomyrinae TaxID=2509459 RepID=A0A4P6EMB4_9MICO|nr:16S rRNA (guanine(527)-N(7))-methyltransferase RsmG [Xylanimonas allomyrinae]QAY63990.1 16S rRNA (guanine(527)-N(7))-methyltransferase RsmG [Xylanimonas allomyrinae]